MKHDGIVFQGPFGLKQGGKGIAVRNPVYIARNGKKEFWGFTIAGDTWKLQVMPEKGWGNKRMLLFLLCGGSIVLLLLIGLTVAVMVLEERRKHFPKNAVIARNGGDEFCLLLPNQTCESIHDKFKEFTRSEKKFCGCKDMDEFFAYTKQKFCNLINKQEQTEVEESIWKQINANSGQENDYVKFSLVRKDGTQVTVFDHGRIVENIYYGRVFYVLLLNKK